MDVQELIQQCRQDTRKWFPGQEEDLGFLALALAGEVGELCNLIKKVERGSLTFDETRAEMGEEAVDVLIYLAMIFGQLGVDANKMYAIKRRRNEQRFGTSNGGRAAQPHPRAV